MKSQTHLLLLGATFAIGLGSGWLIGRADPTSNPREVSSRPSSAREETSRGPHSICTPAPQHRTDRASQQTTKSEQPEPAAATVTITPSALANLALSTPIPLEERRSLFSGADSVAEALGMHSDEKQQLEEAWRQTREGIVKHQLESLEYEELEDSLWISSGPFDGTAIREQFLNQSSSILGAERSQAMWQLLKADQAFGGWGNRPSSSCSLEYISQGDGSLVYRITERDSPDGPARRTWISAELPTHLREAGEHLGLPIQPTE